MTKITAIVDGMRCGMCEAHVKDVIRREYDVEKLTASHSSGEVVVISKDDLDPEAIRKTIDATGYEVKSIKKEPYEKKGFLSGLFGK